MKSPNKMAKAPMKLESAAQERFNLTHINPLSKHMSTPLNMYKNSPAQMAKSAMKMAEKSPMKMGGSWMSKHSALKMMKSPAKLYKKK